MNVISKDSNLLTYVVIQCLSLLGGSRVGEGGILNLLCKGRRGFEIDRHRRFQSEEGEGLRKSNIALRNG